MAHHTSENGPGTQTVAERVQLMLGSRVGRLEYEGTMLAAAALIELVLSGHLGSVPNRGFFNGPAPRKLVVAEASPTGNPILDSALLPLVARGRPWLPHGALAKLGAAVSLRVQEALEATWVVRPVKQYPEPGAYLEIGNADLYVARRDRLAVIRSRPDAVDDPLTGAFIDVLRNGPEGFRGETGLRPYIRWEWYPAESRATIESILQAEATRFTPS